MIPQKPNLGRQYHIHVNKFVCKTTKDHCSTERTKTAKQYH